MENRISTRAYLITNDEKPLEIKKGNRINKITLQFTQIVLIHIAKKKLF